MIQFTSLLQDLEYQNFTNLTDKNLYETYTILGELLNPDYAYPYTQKIKGLWEYNDAVGNTYFVRLVYQPTDQPYFELKTGYYDENSKPKYDPSVPPNSTSQDWDKRSDTVAKIYRDEVIPLFLEQDLCNTLIIKPLEIKRYQFSVRLINKFTPTNIIDVEYNKPKSIILIKK